MSDSHKISLLDLQTQDLSQYGKQKLEPNKGVSRNVDSSYRRQLSESLSKKQPSPIANKKTEPESRSIDFTSDRNRTASKTSDAQSTTEIREDQAAVDTQQREVSRNENSSVSEESSIATAEPEKAASDQVQIFEESSESLESTEELINTQPEANLAVKDRGQAYSLFNTSFAAQDEGQVEQEFISTDSEIHPPANFHFAKDQGLADLQVQVTEASSNEAIPIPEGLADLLKQQVVDTSQTESDQDVQTADATVESNELNSVIQTDESLTALPENAESSSESTPVMHSEELSEIKTTEELKQAVQEYNEKNSDAAAVSSGKNEIDAQSVLQQRHLRNKNEEQSESSSAESGQEEVALDHESVQGISETVIEQVQLEVKTVQTDVTEKTARDSERTEQKSEAVTQGAANQNQIRNPVLEALNQVQSETTKTGSVSQENVSSIERDQSLSQPTAASQSAPTTGTQAATPVGSPVDVKQVEHLVERITGAVRQSQSTGQQLKIRLSPPELGTLQIEVSLKNGEYTAKLEVQNNRVQKVINDNLAQLKDSLAKTGISIDRIEVQINTDSSEDHHSSQSDARSQSGGEFGSNEFSENAGDSDQRQEERAFVEESVKPEDADQSQRDQPQVARSQGVAAGNVDEIDVQI